MNDSTSDGSGTGGSAVNVDAGPIARRFPVVGVAASAGGMEAFIELLRSVPQGTGLAFVLIQHLDPTHPSYLSEALARATKLPVREINDGMRVEPDQIYVIPSNADVGILRGTLTLLPRPAQERRPHLPADFFFKALAADLGSQAIGIVLSGTGSDGSEGLRAIKAEGGVTFAQLPASAKFSGMPTAAVGTGAVDFCLPIPELAQELGRLGHHPMLRGAELEPLASPANETELKKVLMLVRGATGVDFSEYKPASIRRRCARRMAIRRVVTLAEYVRLLREDRAEVQALFEDILIHVTSFFRDGDAFEKLKERVFPEILQKKRARGGAIRIWSAGCSTGEEPYSLLIVLMEFLAEHDATDVRIQLFGTDISDKAVERARAGFYPDAAFRDVSAQRLARFFTRMDGGGYKISAAVREQCAFVKHDLTSDPPFSKLDLICCRNVLIYFGPDLQKRVLATFHFALTEPGFLLLGRAENLAEGTTLFQPVDKENKSFARTAVKSALRLAPARDAFPAAPRVEVRATTSTDVVRRTEGLLLTRYAPPGVIVNGRLEILHFRGRTGPYLEPPPGPPQEDLLKMARKGLVADLRIGIAQAKKDKATVRRAGVRVDQDGSTRVCDIVVIPVSSPPESGDDVFAVLFEEQAPPADVPARGNETSAGPATASSEAGSPQFVARLEEELKSAKEALQSIIGEHQRANEALLAANEELVSSNEELMSLNEELQTGKEELQSTNEELATLNEEMVARNTELNTVNSDLVNILASVEVPIVIVDGARRIRRFTPKARPILNLLPSDVGRPIDDIRPNIAIENLDRKIAEVLDTVVVHEEEVQSREGRWFRLQIRPYTTLDKRIDGAVISVVDIDALRRALGAAEWSRDHAKATVEAVPVPLVLLNEKFEVVSANGAFEERFRVARAAGAGRDVQDFMTAIFPAIHAALEGVRARNESFQKLEVECELPGLGRRALSVAGRAVPLLDGGRLLLVSLEDITERRRAEAERAGLLHDAEAAKENAEEVNRAKDLFLATLSHELRTPLSSLLLSAQLLQMGNLGEAKVRRTAEAIERATREQAQLIDDLLDISRIIAGKLKMEPQPVSLVSTVQAAVEMLGPTAEKRQLELELHLDESLPPLSADPVRLRQIVSNLLTNAIKFSSERGRVTVSLDAADGMARLRVIDAGVGIDPAFLPYIFDRFSQEERGQTRGYGGLGLGLAIVRYLVEAHGGTVRAESAGRGLGSTFTVLLPLATRSEASPSEGAGAPPPREEPAGEASVRDVRILVVEDDETTRTALAEMLALRGAEVRAAPSAAEAMKLFEERPPELLVCDIAMPEEDGYSLLRRIRALGPDRGGAVPAIALTALASEGDRRQALRAGFEAHVAKPVDIDRLVRVLAGLSPRSTARY